MNHWAGRTVLITGGTGSFGRAVIPELIARGVKRVIVFSRDELKQGDVIEAHAGKYPGQTVEGFVGDIRDRDRLHWAFRSGVDVVLHAAALKQVPSCQYNWSEAIATNVTGSENVVKAAIQANVARVVALSTDKACAPINAYGKTKALMEEIVTWSNAWVGRAGQTKLACVRYGNVIGSRGSVIPLWKAQAAAGGPLTVTDPTMTRFWMRLSDAVEFVLSSTWGQRGGEVFIPKLGACTMGDLAWAVAPGSPLTVVGARTGEKRHEAMVCAGESARTYDLGDRFAIYPDQPEWPLARQGSPVADGFEFTSDNAQPIDCAMVAV